MKKLIALLVLLCSFGFAQAALGPRLTVRNNTGCILYYQAFADDYGFCGTVNNTNWVQIQPGGTLTFYGATAPWVAPQINGINWTYVMVAGDPACGLIGGGSPCTNDYTTVSMPCTSNPPNGCFIVTNNCSACSPGTQVNVVLNTPNGYDVNIDLFP